MSSARTCLEDVLLSSIVQIAWIKRFCHSLEAILLSIIMATWGQMDAFDPSVEDWSSYVERCEQCFVVKDIKEGDDKKEVAYIISAMGPTAYKDLKDIVTPKKPKDLTFAELVQHLTSYYEPESTAIMERYRFHTRVQGEQESVLLFVAALRRQASKCDFKTFLAEALRDRFVCGIKDDGIQRKLLSEKDLTFDKSIKIACSMEAASKSSTEMKGNAQPVNKIAATDNRTCYCCGVKGHVRPECPYKDTVCKNCGKKGHITKNCRSQRSSGQQDPKARQDGYYGNHASGYSQGGKPNDKIQKRQWNNTKYLALDSENDEMPVNDEMTVNAIVSDYDVSELYHLGLGDADDSPITVTVELNGQPFNMEVDTGSRKSIISERAYNTFANVNKPQLQNSHVVLRTYSGEQIQPLGEITVEVNYKGQQKQLPVLVAPGNGTALLGRSWLSEIKLDWQSLKQQWIPVHNMQFQDVLSSYPELFKDEIGTMKGVKVSLAVDSLVAPKFFRPRSMPFALRPKVEAELDRLQKVGTITPVPFSQWASPIVPVVKGDGSVRICGDYKVTINQALSVESYPLPTPEDLFATLAGGVIFSKLDLSHAYQQLEVDDTSRQYLTISTHKGLFSYNRLSYGVASAPAIFQRTMENLLQDVDGVAVYLDDILISGKDEADHAEKLRTVLERLSQAGLRLKRQKCIIGAKEVEYLGHKITEKGIQPLQEKVIAVTNAPEPQNVTELQAFIGMITYYNKFLPNLSTTLEPLHRLLRKGVEWEWKTKQQEAFTKVKTLLKSAPVLVHYDASQPLILTVDASSYGLGAVLSHGDIDSRTDQPVAYKSRKLSDAEKNYAQLDKEALAIVFGVKKFHKYVYGRSFRIVTDHKPLLGLLGENKAIPSMASPRMQRWGLMLAGYNYQLVHRPGKSIANADALSRLPLPDKPLGNAPVPGEIILAMEVMDSTPVTSQQIKMGTEKDPILCKVRDCVLNGWYRDVDGDDFKPYNRRKDELSVQDGILMWGSRVVIPPKLRSQMLDELHVSHPGISRMKGLARSYIWWPNLDGDIEMTVRQCTACQLNGNLPASAPLHPWEFPSRPWARVHMDFAGPFLGHMYLLMIDAHTKWLEVHIMGKITSEATIEKCRETFATHGMPEVVVTDNGTSFTSSEFQHFMQQNGVKLIHSAPYHPSSNGLAENAVKTFKAGMKKMSGETLQSRVQKFLFHYRITPHTTTGRPPAELLMGRVPRSRLQMIRPNLHARVQCKQGMQKLYHDRHSRDRSFYCGDSVYVQNFARGDKWLAGTIEKETGPLSYLVNLCDGRLVRRHQDQMKHRAISSGPDEDTTSGMKQGEEFSENSQLPVPETIIQPETDSLAQVPPPANPHSLNDGLQSQMPVTPASIPRLKPPEPQNQEVVVRRSMRAGKGLPPVRLDL